MMPLMFLLVAMRASADPCFDKINTSLGLSYMWLDGFDVGEPPCKITGYVAGFGGTDWDKGFSCPDDDAYDAYDFGNLTGPSGECRIGVVYNFGCRGAEDLPGGQPGASGYFATISDKAAWQTAAASAIQEHLGCPCEVFVTVPEQGSVFDERDVMAKVLLSECSCESDTLVDPRGADVCDNTASAPETTPAALEESNADVLVHGVFGALLMLTL